MKYREKVINYFDFSSGMDVKVKDKTRKSIYISGTVKKSTIKLYSLFVLVFSVASFIATIQIAVLSEVTSMETFNIGILFNNIKGKLLLAILLTVIAPPLTVLILLIKNKVLYKKIEPQPKNINIYQRELPSKLKPAHVRMLLKDGIIDGTTVAATLLDLIDNGYIELSKNRTKLDIFKNEEIILTKTSKSQENLLKYEKFLIEWFIDKCGDGNKVSNIKIKEALSKNTDKEKPSENFEQFQALVMISFPLNRFYQKNEIKERNITIYMILIIVAFLLLLFYIGAILLAWCIGNILFNFPKYSLNQEGVDEKDSWLDLKKFLIDFSNIQDKTPEMIVIWEYYLTYSVALDIDSQASNEMENFFGDEIYNDFGIPLEKELYKDIPNDLVHLKEAKQKLKEAMHRYDDEIEKDVQQELEKYKKIIENELR